MGKKDTTTSPITKSEAQVEVVEPPSTEIKEKKKKVPTEKQLEGLRKGQATIKALAAKRKEIMDRNKIRDAKKLLGQEVSSDEEEVPSGLGKGVPRVLNTDRIDHDVMKMERKAKLKETRAKLDSIRPRETLARRDDLDKLVKKEDFDKLVSMISAMKTTTQVPVEKVVEKEVVREVPVVKERRMSGSALLNEIFFKKQ